MQMKSLRNLQPERIVVKPPRGFARFLLRAARLLKNPALLRQVLAQASSKLGRREGSGALREVKEQLLRLLALLKAYVAGDYRGSHRPHRPLTALANAAAVLLLRAAHLSLPCDLTCSTPAPVPGAAGLDFLAAAQRAEESGQSRVAV